MAQMTPEVSRLLEQALALSVEEREALADSLISNLDGKRWTRACTRLGKRKSGGELLNWIPARQRLSHGQKCASAT